MPWRPDPPCGTRVFNAGGGGRGRGGGAAAAARAKAAAARKYADDDDDEADGTDQWVQCSLCQQWRQVPDEFWQEINNADEDEDWTCKVRGVVWCGGRGVGRQGQGGRVGGQARLYLPAQTKPDQAKLAGGRGRTKGGREGGRGRREGRGGRWQ